MIPVIFIGDRFREASMVVSMAMPSQQRGLTCAPLSYFWCGVHDLSVCPYLVKILDYLACRVPSDDAV